MKTKLMVGACCSFLLLLIVVWGIRKNEEPVTTTPPQTVSKPVETTSVEQGTVEKRPTVSEAPGTMHKVTMQNQQPATMQQHAPHNMIRSRPKIDRYKKEESPKYRNVRDERQIRFLLSRLSEAIHTETDLELRGLMLRDRRGLIQQQRSLQGKASITNYMRQDHARYKNVRDSRTIPVLLQELEKNIADATDKNLTRIMVADAQHLRHMLRDSTVR